MTEGNSVQLGIIFDKANGEYTNDASLYQKILSFSLSGTDHQSFTNYGMCKRLKLNHQSFEKRSVESLQSLVARKIEKLILLKLVHEIGTQEISTGTGQTPVYAFDWMSYFLGWLIESSSRDPARRSEAINKIFNILYLMLEINAPNSMNIFLKSLIRKIKENDFFAYVFDNMIMLFESDGSIKDISDLINHTFMFRHTDPALVYKYNKLWEETLNELELGTRQLVMFRIKLLYEQRMKERAHDLAEFEVARFAAKERFDKLVLECVCLSCQCIRYEMIDLIEYILRLRYHIEGLPALEKDCPSCKNTRSLQIIDL
jgi:hypothetical protein